MSLKRMSTVFLHLDIDPKCMSSNENIAPYLRNIHGNDPKGVKGKHKVMGDRIYDFLSVNLVRKLREELGDVFVGLYFVDPNYSSYKDMFEGVADHTNIIFDLHSSVKLTPKFIKDKFEQLLKERKPTFFNCITNYETYRNPNVLALKPKTREHFGGIMDEL